MGHVRSVGQVGTRGAAPNRRDSVRSVNAADMTVHELGPDAVEHFRRTGWVLTEPFDAQVTAELREWVDEVAARPEESGILHHFEMTAQGPQLCRTENFVPFHDGLRDMLTRGELLDTASMLLGERAVLYKEKINYKLVGGAGFAPHQDAPAYRFVDTHVSCLVAVDDVTIENGCLEVVSGMHAEVLGMDERGCIREDLVAGFDWIPVPMWAGQTLWFHSRTPHRSGPNTSGSDRRALYPTYNAAREGDLREAYYEQKMAEFAADTDETGRISLIGDFEGTIIR